ncbi:MAG: cytochrome P450 [Acidimicrobiales bacterium]|nr:cytochrome P450 [Acidimicrobiales bacterium]
MAASVQVDLDNYDPMDYEVQQCPFPHYAALREQGPLFYHEQTKTYIASRMDIVNLIVRDTETFSSERSNAKVPTEDVETQNEIDAILAKGWPRAETMLTIDPPYQTRYRKLVSRTFSARKIGGYEDKVREIAIDLIEKFPKSGSINFDEAFATPLPVKVIHYALNMSPEVENKVKWWSDANNYDLGANPSKEMRIEKAESIVDCQNYWFSEYEDRIVNPQEDILSDLTHADFNDPDLPEGQTRKLHFPEVYGIIRQLMVAGNETTTKFLNETMRLLIENPQWWEELENDPDGIAYGIVEEGLRASSPTQGLFRTVTQETQIEGIKIPKGARIWVVFAAANRDDQEFVCPEEFIPDRENVSKHLAFGKGHHFCIGAPLSRLEGKVAFEELGKRINLPSFSAQNTFEYEPSYVLRGLAALHLDVEKK